MKVKTNIFAKPVVKKVEPRRLNALASSSSIAGPSKPVVAPVVSEPKKKTALEEIIEEEMRKKRRFQK